MLENLRYDLPEVELKLGTYNAPQRNNCLNVKIIAPSTRTTQLTEACDQLCAWFGKEQNIHAESELRNKLQHCLPGSLSLHAHTTSSRDPHLVFD